ncbi:helicase-associated domain-containing protein [Streptomyces halobius]|uniref:Helicase-associated domain-containing protein n=1 Tax=Streptomyces halobius TaxID=2879846 RepID=A0ABY4M3W0_9ACTN|nr:helicase-associated domain-containing protein [Streptomyces halobius]UQA91873.1 helicase-associated domain-containing protein [Streptomyces halobius]
MIPISDSCGSSLPRWLRTLDAERLRAVLDARTDAVRPPEPCTLGELAERLQRPGAVARTLPRLPLPCLQVSEALAALGNPVSREQLAGLLGTDGDGLEATLRTLADHALVWPGPTAGELHMATALGDAWETPLGLGPGLRELLSARTSEELRKITTTLGLAAGARKQERLGAVLAHHGDPGRLRTLIDSAPARSRELLERRSGMENTPPLIMYSSAPRADSSERWLLDRALLVGDPYGYAPARMPAEVALTLRGPDWHAPFDPVPPQPALVEVGAAVEREAAAAATSFIGQAAALLSECAARPLGVLKSGGVGARELARVGKAVQCEETVVRVVLESAYTAGLLAYEGKALLVTEAYDAWAGEDPAGRYVALAEAWWRLGLTPSGSRDEDGKALPAVVRNPSCAGCLAARHGLLAAAAALPEGHGVRDSAELGALVTWQRPFADGLPHDATPFAGMIREAELLGVLARGALSPLGAALFHDDSAALYERAGRLLPGAVAKARAGADLTAVVTGVPTAGLAELLDALAEREERGTASVWRFTPASLRRALDGGRTPEEIEAGLCDAVEGPLPQPLTYLIADAARRHGHVRLAPAACVIHSDDTALIAEIAVHRGLTGLGLRRLAPTVLVCRTSLPDALGALRAEGYAPAAETDDGTVRVERSARPRASGAPSPPSHPPLPLPRQQRAAEGHAPEAPAAGPGLAARLLAAPDHAPHPDPTRGIPYRTDTEEILDGWAKALTLTDVRQLAHAIDNGEPVTIEYIAASGNRTIRTVSELDFEPPHLYAYCHLRGDDRVFTLSHIQSVLPV